MKHIITLSVAFVAFLATWWFVEFQTPAVYTFIKMSTVATLIATLVPHERFILGACAENEALMRHQSRD